MDSCELNVCGYRRDQGGEYWLFLWHTGREIECKQQIRRWAERVDLSFNWYDAARVMDRVRRLQDMPRS